MYRNLLLLMATSTLLLLSGCGADPSEGAQGDHLRLVPFHYRCLLSGQKAEAASFLLENMPYHQSAGCVLSVAPRVEAWRIETDSLCAMENNKYEVQLEHAIMKGKASTRGDEHVPCLERYYECKEIRSYDDVELILDEMFSASSYVVVPESDAHALQLLSVPEIEVLTGMPIREVYDVTIYRLRDQVRPGMKILETVWRCDGKEYHSRCIVSLEDGVLFDPIGSYIVEKTSSSEPMMSPPSILSESQALIWVEHLWGDIQRSQGNNEEARTAYETMSRMCPNRFIPLYRLFQLAEEEGDAEKATLIAKSILQKPVKVESPQVDYIKAMCKTYINN